MGEENDNPVAEDTQTANVEAEASQEVSEDSSQEEDKQVPLKALQAERKKRQEAEYQAKWLQEQMAQASQQKQSVNTQDDDGDELITKADYSRMTQAQLAQVKREALEESFVASNPEAAEVVNTELEDLLKTMPELAHAIQNSNNRYKTAYTLIKQFKDKGNTNIKKKLEENKAKPGSPAAVGKQGAVGMDFSKMSNDEFRKYRQSVRSGRR